MRIRTFAAAVAVTGLALAACGSDGGGDADGASASSGASASTGGRANPDATVTIGAVLEPTSLDITRTSGVAPGQILLGNVYEGLVKRDQKGVVSPALATSYKISPDGRTYTFTLADNAAFQDGAAVRAADVVSSLTKVIAPNSTNPHASDLASISAVASPDPHTVVLTLKERDSGLLFNLTGPAGVVVREGATGLDGHPDGTGPFRFDSWRRGDSITLVRNDAYRGPKAKVARVVFRYLTAPNAQNNAVRTGQVDVGVISDNDLVEAYRGNPKFLIAEGTTTDKFTLAFNQDRGPLADARVRHAIRQGIDKDGLIKVLGAGTRIGSPVPPLDPWYEDLTSIDRYDPASARRLLAQAGHGGGLRLGLTIPNIYPQSIGDYVASQLREIGVTVDLRRVEFPAWLTGVYTKHDYDLSIVDHAEARDLAFYVKPGYYFGDRSPQASDLAKAGATAASDADRDTALRALARRYSEDAIADWLLLGKARQVARVGVTGYPTDNVSATYDLSKIEVAKS
ncbi:ABC-type dipeptide transport system, periplasmic component [Frankia torreyi]|uniref:ABC-type dipeptide transport system, periplasmic component n=2 Tax=Frankia TaxID=1854 RepID=A0A0D8B9Z4_9ACTN|nr:MULTISPECIES: ABC transporter substrate-binding protein [Frankia]KJE20739.1 ABC-type dipeptide transport system, periplasmic component [Frankia torreyi]KQC39912.1 peptide ABC transporter [Frankia sp. ACN1ag]